MAKNIIFSFDDGRIDTYTNAYRILKKYGFTATINIATAFVENEELFQDEFLTSLSKSMTIDNVKECFNYGLEIASHGDMHSNEIKDIKNGIEKLRAWGITGDIGFASPRSYYCRRNYGEIKELVDNKTIAYVRSGIRLKRDGIIHGILSILAGKLNSCFLFKVVNKRNVIKPNKKYDILPAVTVNSIVNNDEIISLISSIKDNENIILMYHAVIDKDDEGTKTDKWYNTTEDFENLCNYLSKQKDINVIRTIDLVKGVLNV